MSNSSKMSADTSRSSPATAPSSLRSLNSDADSRSREDGERHSIQELIDLLNNGGDAVDVSPALQRRVRDFKFARQKRRERHGDQRPWGVFGLYAHLADVRADLEWAEDAAWRRRHARPYLSWTDFETSRDEGLVERPWFTYAVILLCSIMMVIAFWVNGWRIEALKVNPLIGPSSDTLIRVGARQTSLIVNDNQWFRLLSPMVLHAGLVHFLVNMLALWYFGAAIELNHGSINAAILFVVAAVGGNILSAIFLPQYISVGASGGIFGLIGGCCADIVINWNLLFIRTDQDEADDARARHCKVLFWLALDIVVNGLIGFTPFVDNFTHLGGLLYGFCCGLSVIERLGVGFFGVRRGKVARVLLKFLGLIVSVVFIMITTILLVESDGSTSPCHACRYVSCVPFPFRDDKWWYCDDCDQVIADLYKNTDTGLYDQIDLTCPTGVVTEIVIAEDELTDREQVRRNLPSYCREFCDDVFISD